MAKPRFVSNIDTGETGWFSSPALVDLNGDGRREIVAPFYSTFVFDAKGRLLGKGTATDGRVYAPGVVADLDSDGVPEIVVGGNDGNRGGLQPRRRAAAGQGRLAGLDLQRRAVPGDPRHGGGRPRRERQHRDGRHDDEHRDRLAGVRVQRVRQALSPRWRRRGWPRYNASDRTFNGIGNHGYGAYGENVGIGNLDDDPQLEVVVTFDNHQINVFNHDGTSVLTSRWYTNRESGHEGRRLGWGQFIRWLNPRVEARHYHRHAGPWPDVRRTPWLQWTASPPSVADLDRDGRNEVIGLPNVERGIPYRTHAYAFVVLDGAQRGGGRSARRHKGFERPR